MILKIENFLSPDNFQQAWEKVARKKGCAGIDNQTIKDFSRQEDLYLTKLRRSVGNGTYIPNSYKQVTIPKSHNSWRELKIPTVKDRIVQQALLNVLHPIIDPQFSDSSFAYRPNISYLQAVEKVSYWRDRDYHWVLDADIVKYFDRIQHRRLLVEVRKKIDCPNIICLIKLWLSVKTLTKEGTQVVTPGISQGSVISPLLANIYLDEFDRIIDASDFQLVRYADDFVLLFRSHQQLTITYQAIAQLLNSFGLTLHPEKTKMTNFERGFCFLGHQFDKNSVTKIKRQKQKKKQKK